MKDCSHWSHGCDSPAVEGSDYCATCALYIRGGQLEAYQPCACHATRWYLARLHGEPFVYRTRVAAALAADAGPDKESK